MDDTSIRGAVAEYYGEKLEAHGANARGVDWNTPESQQLRFIQLLKLIDQGEFFTINDYGCGYGALADFLKSENYAFRYCGFDISSPMITRAREMHARSPDITFVATEEDLPEADYTVASGIFNVKLETPRETWKDYMLQTLRAMNKLSKRGFAFNSLTKYCDPERQRADLYYADPVFLFDYCRTTFSRFVTLLHDYPLYEFTLLVRKARFRG